MVDSVDIRVVILIRWTAGNPRKTARKAIRIFPSRSLVKPTRKRENVRVSTATSEPLISRRERTGFGGARNRGRKVSRNLLPPGG